MKAKDIMTEIVITVSENQTVKQVKKIFRENKINGAPVLDENESVVGIITVNDLLEAFSDENENPRKAKVKKYMSKNVISFDTEKDIISVFKLMQEKHIHRIIIKQDEKLEGIISTTDAYRVLLRIVNKPELIKQLFTDMM